MTTKHFDATIFVPTLNGEEFLEQLIQAVFSQKTKLTYELFIIDSGSTDATLDIIAKHPKVRLHQIPNSEFGHGKTRNLAASMSNSTYMVFLTQDAVPAQHNWLNGMIEPFGISDKLVGVFGKQIPRPNCTVTIKREVKSVFDGFGSDLSIMVQRRGELVDSLGIKDVSGFFSDVNSAIRSDILKGPIPFRDVKYSEDQAFGDDALSKGYIKAYAPFGAVYHSNDLKLGNYYKRRFDEAYGLRKATGAAQVVTIKELIVGSIRATLRDWIFVVRDKEYSFLKKCKEIVKAPMYNVAIRKAIRKAATIPDELANKHSLEHKLKTKAR
ncbi:glycosyltransferase family 2 protein [bacterium]|nr:glycosyltransferase family 2 protein [bacterium]NBX98003.1 glycosyltransferase family 2 protein [bacterium]NDC95186.1 glycosyltransferase family 2 protein [bacterium]NDD84954.1 glycosyltransferase family 2 protein [bacterium]NDG31231.1 glycosyltransferase family 2 protein [bacterium]